MSHSKPCGNNFVIVDDETYLHSDIFSVVDCFYRSIAVHSTLKEPFNSVYDWPEHIDKMTHFWWIKFGGKPYQFSQYNPILKHYYAGFNENYLSDWLELFHKTLDTQLTPGQANVWKDISIQMGRGLLDRNEMLKAQKSSNHNL